MKEVNDGSYIEPNELLCLLFDDLKKSSDDFLTIIKKYIAKIVDKNFEKKLDNNLIKHIFTYLISTSSKEKNENDTLFFYKYYIKFLIKKFDNPFNQNLIDIPSILTKNPKAIQLYNISKKHWSSNLNNNENYLELVSKVENCTYKDLLKFLINENLQIRINKNFDEHSSEIKQILGLYLNKLYYEGYTDKAIEVLQLFPKSWETLWNQHLCNPVNNKYTKELLNILENEKNLMEHQNILFFQVSLKELLNYIDTGFEDYSNISSNIVNKISNEVEEEIKKYPKFDDDLAVEIFSKKLFKYVIFDKAIELFNSIPKKTKREHRVALYIDFKQIFEACLENNIKESNNYLELINKVLFEELKDETSGTNLISQMLMNKKQKGISQYIKKLSYILDPYSIEMETLFEALILFFSKTKIQNKQLSIYLKTFKEINVSQFRIIYELLLTFNKDENNIERLSKTICNNLDIFKKHSQTFYILVDVILNKKFKIQTHQKFLAIILSSNLNNALSSNFLYLLVDHFFEQPYRDFKKHFPVSTLNFKLIEQLLILLEQTKVAYMKDKNNLYDFEEKKYAIRKAKDFFQFLLSRVHVKNLGARI